MTTRLRVGLLMDSYEVTAWELALIERLLASPQLGVELIVLNDCPAATKSFLSKKRWGRLLYSLFTRVDRILFPARPDAFESRDGRQLLEDVRVCKVRPLQTQYSDRFPEESVKTIQSADLDVLVRLGFRILRGDILRAARYGVWSFHHGDNQINRGGPAGFWETAGNWPVTGSLLQILNDDLDNGCILARSWSTSHPFSPNRNRNGYFWKTLSLLPRKLEELQEVGQPEFSHRVSTENRHPQHYDRELYREPSNIRMLPILTRLTLRLLSRSWSKLFFREQWILLFCFGRGKSSSFRRFKSLEPPDARFWADPHVLEKDGVYYIFFEDYSYRAEKGRIAVIQLDRDGRFSAPTTVLEEEHHLSYPFVFDSDGELFMVPEAHDKRVVPLYRCVRFPDRWEQERNLLSDINAVDATIHRQDERWWLFANVAENDGVSFDDELFLYYTDDLLAESWLPHPRNPVVSDARQARPAGRLFFENGKLYRPSQDCSFRYGSGLRINWVRSLNQKTYEEITVSKLTPAWDRRLFGMHSYSRAGELTVVDALRLRRRF